MNQPLTELGREQMARAARGVSQDGDSERNRYDDSSPDGLPPEPIVPSLVARSRRVAWTSLCDDSRAPSQRGRLDESTVAPPGHTPSRDASSRGSERRHRPIGVFDSGLGGLTVVKEMVDRLPHESILYFGDTARV